MGQVDMGFILIQNSIISCLKSNFLQEMAKYRYFLQEMAKNGHPSTGNYKSTIIFAPKVSNLDIEPLQVWD